MKDYGTLWQAINKLKIEEGYIYDFNLIDDQLAVSENDKYENNEFEVDKILRFEGMSNPDDNAILYAITTNDLKRGILLDGYGLSGGQISKGMLQKLHIHPEN